MLMRDVQCLFLSAEFAFFIRKFSCFYCEINQWLASAVCSFFPLRFDISWCMKWCMKWQEKFAQWNEKNMSIRCFLVAAAVNTTQGDDDVCNNKNLSQNCTRWDPRCDAMLTDTSHSIFPISHIHSNRIALCALYANICDLPLRNIKLNSCTHSKQKQVLRTHSWFFLI